MRAATFERGASHRADAKQAVAALEEATAKAIKSTNDIMLRPFEPVRVTSTERFQAKPWQCLLVAASVGLTTILVPDPRDPAVQGSEIVIKNDSDSTNAITLVAPGSNIDGAATRVQSQARGSTLLLATATGWISVGSAQGSTVTQGVQSALLASYTQPGVAGKVTISVDNTAWMRVGGYVRVSVGGNYLITAIPTSTTVTIENTNDQLPTANAAVSSTVPAGGTVTIGAESTKWIVTDGSTYPNMVYSTALGNGAIGNGSVTGMWRRIGDSVEVVARITFGSTSTFGTGITDFFRMTLPNSYTRDPATSLPNTNRIHGTIYMLDASTQTNNRSGLLQASTVDNNVFFIGDRDTAQPAFSTFPWTWTTSDVINSSFTCPVLVI